MAPERAPPTEIVLVGAGHTHTNVLRVLGRRPLPLARLTLVTRQAQSLYSGMLPGFIAGHYCFDEIHIDARRLCAFAGARFVEREVVGIDTREKRVLCSDGGAISYDLLSIDIGSARNTSAVPGAENTIPVKPIDLFLGRFEAARRRILERGGRARICVVGAGAGGVELLLSLERRLRRDIVKAGFDPAGLSCSICSQSAEILMDFPQGLRRRFQGIIESRNIKLIMNARVTRVENSVLHFDGKPALPFDEIFWATGAAAPPWLAGTGLKLDGSGFIETQRTLESASHAGVFAAGDIASFKCRPLPKAGVYAVRQAPVLAKNLRGALEGRALTIFRPQRRILLLISTGERYAIGTRNGLVFEGAWAWGWKDWIDRHFIRKFQCLSAP